MKQVKGNLCKQHNEEIIGVNCSANQSQNENQLCLKCLVPILKKSQILTVDNAVEMMANIKQEFSLNMEEQNNKNLEKIKTILSDVIQTKTSTDQQLNKVIDNLQSWITNIQKQNSSIQQKANELSTLNIAEFQQALIQLQDNNQSTVELKTSIQQQLISIAQGEQIEKCLKLLDSIEFISQNTDCDLINEDQDRTQDKYKTPYLQLRCSEHSTEVIMLDINENRNSEKRLACVYCQYDNKTYYTPIKVAQELWSQYQKQKNKQINELEYQGKQKINQLKSIFQSLGEVYQSTIEDIITYLDQILVDIYQLTNEHNQEFNKNWNQYTKEEIINIAETLSISQIQGLLELNIDIKLKEKDKQINKKINDQLLKLNEKITQTNDKIKLIIQQNQVNLQDYIIEQQQIEEIKVIQEDQEQQKTIKIINKDETIKKEDNQVIVNKQFLTEQIVETQLQPINYQILDQYTIQQNEYCYCLCFNKDQNILAVGGDYDIKIFQFEDGEMTELQLLKGHTYWVNALYIGNNNQIYSCSDDKTIKIWVYQSNQEWKLHQTLKEHSGTINCIVVNKVEDQIITGSDDQSIKCWMKTQDQWKCVQTLQHHSNRVLSLSLNESQNQLLSGGRDQKLNIFKCDSNKQWSLTQTIEVDYYVNRASFIGDCMIVAQLENIGSLRIYEYNQTEFSQKQDLYVAGGGDCLYFFPQVYCKQQSILLNKNSKFINIIRSKKDQQFVIEQAIEFDTSELYGTISDNAKYLVTWDSNSKEIQVRQFE